ncbi:M24 family metallopeptidase [Leucobacter rhizosphaerae]|uniref:M24 family metallopeptidase n=1 Tax=Leucobacter rhizosphaerae TaxID=2932245 RepID=A0ABY4FS08_9MICO|nr:M24 family metallopeptidase [Leucobacter rhizosphaerae]UOQ59072.1 M24 family metallopeptidase [Leucobacter rhizosphaerae]
MTSAVTDRITQIPVSELKDRISRIRDQMRARGIDVLLVAGLQDIFNRGHVRYVSNLGGGGMIVLPLEGNLTHFIHPVLAGSPKIDKVGDIREFIDVRPFGDGAYGFANDSVGLIERMAVRGKVGYVGGSAIGVSVYNALRAAVGEDRIVDASDIFWKLRAVKSPNEIELMRRSAAIADDCYDMLTELVAPGVSDYTVYAETKKFLFEHESPYSLEVIDADGPFLNFDRNPTGDVLESGGTLFMEITPGYGGYYAQLPVSMPVDELSPDLKRLAAAWHEGFTLGESMLRPGAVVSDVSKAMRARIAEHGAINPFSHGHAIGLDVSDGWVLGDQSDVPLEVGMTMAVHPAALTEIGGAGFTAGYTYLITEDGAERLSRHNFYYGW